MIGKLSDIEINQVLTSNYVGRLGCTDGKTVYVVPINYLFDGRYILAHSPEGKKIKFMRSNPDVCFEVDEVDNMQNWRSVILWGKYEEIDDEIEKEKIMESLVANLMKLKVSEPVLLPHLNEPRARPHAPGYIQVVIWRIDVNKKSGRFEKN